MQPESATVKESTDPSSTQPLQQIAAPESVAQEPAASAPLADNDAQGQTPETPPTLSPADQPTKHKPDLKPQSPTKPKDLNQRTAIIATVIIVLGLAILAVYAYTKK